MLRYLRIRLEQGRTENGLTLIEVVIAMLIFAIVSTGVIYAMLSVLSITRDSRARQVAANLAAEQIDLARAKDDLFQLLDADVTVPLNGDTFRVHQATQWVSDPGLDFTCGASGGAAGGALRYKRVNVTVTWDNMRPSTDPVRADTVIDPKKRINDPTKGTILVSVLTAAGTGSVGVTVSTTPSTGSVIASTDAQGCTYILKVNPGAYAVTISRLGSVDDHQQTSATQNVTVAAGSSASLGFQYDVAATYTTHLATNFAAPPGVTVRVPGNLKTSFLNTYGIFVVAPTSGSGALTQQYALHPFPAGYVAYAGECQAADPAAWPSETVAGGVLQGVRTPVVAAGPGGSTTTDVPMGIVTIPGGTTGGSYLKAVSQTPAAGMPGCDTTITYTFGAVLTTSPTTIALPFGSWKLYRGSSSTDMPTNISSLQLPSPAVPERTSIDATGVVTLDPRVVVGP